MDTTKKLICPECESGLLKGAFNDGYEITQTFKCRGKCSWKVKIVYSDPRDFLRAMNIEKTLL